MAFGGPDGGDGGKGGSIVLQGDSQYWTLIHLKYQRHQFAEDGQCGSGARSSGRDARDIVIPVPLGTVARRVVEQEDGTTLTEDVGEVTADGEQLVLLKGGRGGLETGISRAPRTRRRAMRSRARRATKAPSSSNWKVLADVGLVGFPNAGKSTFALGGLGCQTQDRQLCFHHARTQPGHRRGTRPQVVRHGRHSGYHRGAHEGRGLGTRFLRHIERNSVLLFMIPADSDDLKRDYAVLLGELTQYNPELLDKQRLLAITKCDMLDDGLIEEMKSHLPEGVLSVFISSVSGLNIPRLKDMLWDALQQ